MTIRFPAISYAVAACVASLALGASASELPPQYRADESAAVAGDYNAQRNLAYRLSTDTDAGKWRKQGCAWYLSIPYLNPTKFHAGDAGNAKVYCSPLSPMDYREATAQSVQIVHTLLRKR